MNPPAARNAKQPMDSGMGIASLRPVAGSKRLSDGALMSTQYSTRSRPDHTGHSPRLALLSRTQAKVGAIDDPLGPRGPGSGQRSRFDERFLRATYHEAHVGTDRDPRVTVIGKLSDQLRSRADDAAGLPELPA